MPGTGDEPIRCARQGCAHRYDVHAPGGGSCLYWFPLNGEHCDCYGFRFVPVGTEPVPRSGR